MKMAKCIKELDFSKFHSGGVKQGKVYSEYEKLCGIQHGGSRPKNSVLKITQQEIAIEIK